MKSLLRPISVAVSTPPSHGGDSGSSPGSATKKGVVEKQLLFLHLLKIFDFYSVVLFIYIIKLFEKYTVEPLQQKRMKHRKMLNLVLK